MCTGEGKNVQEQKTKSGGCGFRNYPMPQSRILHKSQRTIENFSEGPTAKGGQRLGGEGTEHKKKKNRIKVLRQTREGLTSGATAGERG